MEVVSAILVGATLINAAKNFFELAFMVGDDPAREKSMRFRTGGFDRNNGSRHYLLTIEGNTIVGFEPVD